METNTEDKEYECTPCLVCNKCGRENNVNGNYITHIAGTISFQIYNADSKCLWCRIEKEKEKSK